MRMNFQEGPSAQEWLATADEKTIAKVIKEYGEDRFAVSIAKAIIASREQGIAIRTTRQLATLVASVVRSREYDQDPATRTFQAIRIFINQELHDLEEGLKMSLNLLQPGGRLVVISFHSLEDRLVKQFMQQNSKVDVPRGFAIRESDLPKSPLKIISRVKPSADEIAQNPRSRSAVMRVAEKVGMQLMTCSLMLVYSQQRSRMLYAEKNRLEMQEMRLNQEWGRLEFEQRDLSKSTRIVDIATKQLHMKDAKQDKTIYIRDKSN